MVRSASSSSLRGSVGASRVMPRRWTCPSSRDVSTAAPATIGQVDSMNTRPPATALRMNTTIQRLQAPCPSSLAGRAAPGVAFLTVGGGRRKQFIRHDGVQFPMTFSVRCENCDRWIWCGKEERESACVCGHRYRVSFDLSSELAWSATKRVAWSTLGAFPGVGSMSLRHVKSRAALTIVGGSGEAIDHDWATVKLKKGQPCSRA